MLCKPESTTKCEKWKSCHSADRILVVWALCQGRELEKGLYLSFLWPDPPFCLYNDRFITLVDVSKILPFQPTNLFGAKRGKPLPDWWLQGARKMYSFSDMLFSMESLVMVSTDGLCMWALYTRAQNLSHTSSERVCTETTHFSPVQGSHDLQQGSECSLPHTSHCREAQKENPSSKPNL